MLAGVDLFAQAGGCARRGARAARGQGRVRVRQHPLPRARIVHEQRGRGVRGHELHGPPASTCTTRPGSTGRCKYSDAAADTGVPQQHGPEEQETKSTKLKKHIHKNLQMYLFQKRISTQQYVQDRLLRRNPKRVKIKAWYGSTYFKGWCENRITFYFLLFPSAENFENKLNYTYIIVYSLI